MAQSGAATGERRVAGLILAGGGGSRMGGVLKANLVVGQHRLLDLVRERLEGCAPVLLSIGPHDPMAFAPLDGLVPVADAPDAPGGPLAGVAASIGWLLAEEDMPDLLLTVAGDSPALPDDLLDRLVAGIGDRPGVIAAYDGQVYPTNGLWRISALRDLPERHRAGTAPNSLKRLAAELGAGTVSWPAGKGVDPFVNLNTPEELSAFRRRYPDGK